MKNVNEEIVHALARAFRHMADLLDEQSSEEDSQLGAPKRLRRALKCAGCTQTIKADALGRFATIEGENMVFHDKECFEEFQEQLNPRRRK